MEKRNIALNDFVIRQVKGSGKTYFSEISFKEILSWVNLLFGKGHYRKGYRDGVIVVEGVGEMTQYFKCPYVKIDENTGLTAKWIKRREGEEPYIQIRSENGTPVKTGKVEFILYRHDVLAENNENTTEAEWELISIHAIPEGVEKLPMSPVTMMRNQLQLPGGTAGHYSSEDWAESVRFWQRYASLESGEQTIS